MKFKPLIIVLGEPFSIFSEILFKSLKNKNINKFKKKIILIGSRSLLEKQMFKLGYKFKFNEIKIKDINNFINKENKINIININFKYKKIFDIITSRSSSYIHKSFEMSVKLIKKNRVYGLINGPISKKNFLNKKYLGITEYLSKKIDPKINPTMLIYNPKLSVSPVTTHLPIRYVSRKLSQSKIINNVNLINNFYKKFLNKKPKFAILGLNPHCETVSKYSEEDKIIVPAIKKIKNKRIDISGPYSADTFFSNKNLYKYDVVIGMYHDQVLTPIKTIFKFDAINITLGLPFVRISPDHGPNSEMVGKNISDPKSLISAINFIKKIKC